MHSAYSDTDGTLYEAFPQSTSRAELRRRVQRELIPRQANIPVDQSRGMRVEAQNQVSKQVTSAILNCVCPECGGALDLSTSEFRCRGECGKDWRPVWDGARSDSKEVWRAKDSCRARGAQKLSRAGRW